MNWASRDVYLRYSRFICDTCDLSAFLKIYLRFSKFICVAEILSAIRQYPAPFKNGNPFNCLLFAGEKRKCPFTCSKAPFVFSPQKKAQPQLRFLPITFSFRFLPKRHLCQGRFQMKRRSMDRFCPFRASGEPLFCASPICLLESYPLSWR